MGACCVNASCGMHSPRKSAADSPPNSPSGIRLGANTDSSLIATSHNGEKYIWWEECVPLPGALFNGALKRICSEEPGLGHVMPTFMRVEVRDKDVENQVTTEKGADALNALKAVLSSVFLKGEWSYAALVLGYKCHAFVVAAESDNRTLHVADGCKHNIEARYDGLFKFLRILLDSLGVSVEVVSHRPVHRIQWHEPVCLHAALAVLLRWLNNKHTCGELVPTSDGSTLEECERHCHRVREMLMRDGWVPSSITAVQALRIIKKKMIPFTKDVFEKMPPESRAMAECRAGYYMDDNYPLEATDIDGILHYLHGNAYDNPRVRQAKAGLTSFRSQLEARLNLPAGTLKYQPWMAVLEVYYLCWHAIQDGNMETSYILDVVLRHPLILAGEMMRHYFTVFYRKCRAPVVTVERNEGSYSICFEYSNCLVPESIVKYLFENKVCEYGNPAYNTWLCAICEARDESKDPNAKRQKTE